MDIFDDESIAARLRSALCGLGWMTVVDIHQHNDTLNVQVEFHVPFLKKQGAVYDIVIEKTEGGGRATIRTSYGLDLHQARLRSVDELIPFMKHALQLLRELEGQ